MEGFEKVPLKVRNRFRSHGCYLYVNKGFFMISKELAEDIDSGMTSDIVSLYEKGNLFALVPEIDGNIRINTNKKGYKGIYSKDLFVKITEKLNCKPWDRLPAVVRGGMLFFSDKEENVR